MTKGLLPKAHNPSFQAQFMAKWEYKVTGGEDERIPAGTSLEEWLNQFGSEGWEVVAAGGGGSGSDRHENYFFTIILKREISD